MLLLRLSFSCECFYVALVAGQEKGIGKVFIYLFVLSALYYEHFIACLFISFELIIYIYIYHDNVQNAFI